MPAQIWSDEERARIAEEALEAISNGTFLAHYCRDAGHKYSNVYNAIFALENGSQRYSRAREIGYSCRLEEIEAASLSLLGEVKSGSVVEASATVSALREWRCTAQWNAAKFAQGRFRDKEDAPQDRPQSVLSVVVMPKKGDGEEIPTNEQE